MPTFGTRWLLPRLPDFARQYPDITLNLSGRTRAFMFDDSGLDAIQFVDIGRAIVGQRMTLEPGRQVLHRDMP